MSHFILEAEEQKTQGKSLREKATPTMRTLGTQPSKISRHGLTTILEASPIKITTPHCGRQSVAGRGRIENRLHHTDKDNSVHKLLLV